MRIWLLRLIVLSVVAAAVQATAAGQRPLDVYFFYSQSCPHCHHQMELMRAVAGNNDDVIVHFLEVSANRELWHEYLDRYQLQFTGVPRTFIGDLTFVGYSASIVALTYSEAMQGYLGNRAQIVKAIEHAVGHKISLGGFGELDASAQRVQPAMFWPLLLPIFYMAVFLVSRNRLRRLAGNRVWAGIGTTVLIISLFLLLGTIPEAVVQAFAQRLPYPLFVVTIALVDGFNPCAFTVLIILLSLLTYSKSRKDMLILGATFIATSAIMYFLFIMLLVLVGSFFLQHYGKVIMVTLGAVITAAGLLNVKDFFFLNRGPSLSLSDEQKTTFTKKAAAIVRGLGSAGRRLWLAIAGTIALGVFVNLVELGCTAILPAVYLTTLVSRYDGYAAYTGWTALYAVVYIVPLLAILFNFLYVFKSVRITESQGRGLKLFAGAFMVFFGLLMIFKPELLAFG